MEKAKLSKFISLLISRDLKVLTHGVDGHQDALDDRSMCYESYGRDAPCSWCQRAHAMRMGTCAHAMVDTGQSLREFRWMPMADRSCLCLSTERQTTMAEPISLANTPTEDVPHMSVVHPLETETLIAQVCHDLRSPLFTMKGFLSIFVDASDVQSLSAASKHQLKRITDSLARLEHIMRGVVDYTAIAQDKTKFSIVDLSEIATAIMNELRSTAPQRQVDLRITPHMQAYGDEQMLYAMMENLLGNAWKYTSRKPLSRIEFSVKLQDEKSIFFIRDNGAGFDMSTSSALFQPFQRLHGMDEFPGTGLGLASVKRILDLHKGNIWCDAAFGHGATFYFTLPEATL